MTMSYAALCSDFYINAKLTSRMELPRSREPVLELFERIKREYPKMAAFRRYKDELALESGQDDVPHRWMAIRSHSVRTGIVNPETEDQIHDLHRSAAEVCPYYLSISPLDVESVEMLFGFDLAARANHDTIVASALLDGSPLAALVDLPTATVRECQPLVGLALDHGLHASVEVKTRSAKAGAERPEPISLYVTVRSTEPVTDLKQLPARIDTLAARGRELVDTLAVPALLMPLREEIASASF